MNHSYHDIISRIPEPPKWWDEFAVPRYCDFSPDHKANIYADQVVLLEIACQNCNERFHVAMSQSKTDRTIYNRQSLLGDVDALHYGDPPNTDCCLSGATMNSIPLRVLEAWHRDIPILMDWERVPELERKISCDWAGEDMEVES